MKFDFRRNGKPKLDIRLYYVFSIHHSVRSMQKPVSFVFRQNWKLVCLILVVLVAGFHLPGSREVAAQEEKEQSEGIKLFEKKLEEWRKVIIEIQILRQEYYLARTLDEALEIKKKFEAGKVAGDKIIEELKLAAARAYIEKPREGTDYYAFLINSLISDLEFTERQDIAYELAKALNSRPISRADIARRVGLSLFLNSEFDDAEKLLNYSLNSAEGGSSNALREYVKLIPRLKTLWEKELKSREADKKTQLPRAIFETTKGTFVVELFENDAPNTVKNFVSLAQKGFYDDLPFMQVLPFSYALTGSPNGTILGSPGYVLKNEAIDPAKRRGNFRGSLCTPARKDSASVAGSLFMITFGPYAKANTSSYCNFGRVIEGMGVIDRLERSHDKENEKIDGFIPDKIIKVTVENLRETTKYEPEIIRVTN